MQRLLLSIDGSPCSTRAVQHVIRKAKGAPLGAYEIHLLNVQPPLPSGVTSFVSHEQVAGFQGDESKKALADGCALLDEAGLAYHWHAEVGPLAQTIVELSEKLHCDEIVMGTHGRGAIADFLIGSTVTRVLHLTKLPLLLVK